jgi:acyl phosphate:glycerol-3-phosphate acyltransferase
MVKHEILFVLFSYLLGAVPFGFIVYYLTERKDIRSEGSGNIGATNVLRTKGKSAAIITLFLDIAKGALPVLYGLKHFDSPVIVIAGGVAAILGHLFPVYIKFKGGKGIATFLGVFLVYYFPAALIFGITFIITVYFTRYISAGSIAAVIAVFFAILFSHVVEVSILVSIIAVLLTLRHSDNIHRIAAGEENQFAGYNHE